MNDFKTRDFFHTNRRIIKVIFFKRFKQQQQKKQPVIKQK